MLLVWAVAVFGFQILLRVMQKPVPEKSLSLFESFWPAVVSGDMTSVDYKAFLQSLVLVKGKNMVKPDDQVVVSEAINYVAFTVFPDSIKAWVSTRVKEAKALQVTLVTQKDQQYLDTKALIRQKQQELARVSEPFTGFQPGSLEAGIFVSSLQNDSPVSPVDGSLSRLPEIMQLYLTHNQSRLTDARFLGFPFHYFYTAVFLLILFVGLCIAYNILVEWRLSKEGIVE
jgi:hypothetical protein